MVLTSLSSYRWLLCISGVTIEHSVPMVTHHIGGQVLTIEVSTHADVGDINMHCTAISGKSRQGAVYASY